MPKPLSPLYEPRTNDIRSESTGDGKFRVSVFTGKAWTDLRSVESEVLAAITGGLTLQGGQKGAYYWRNEPEIQTPAQTWYSVPETRKNKGWQKPHYHLGQLVWMRHHPSRYQPAYIMGVIYDQGDYSDEDAPIEPGWMYQLSNQEGQYVGEQALCDRSELSALVLAAEEREAAADDFDPFLNSDDLP